MPDFHIVVMAGEESGDLLGGAMLAPLRADLDAAGCGLRVSGIGGRAMQESGLGQSFFPMSDLSVMGVFEILPRLPHLLSRIQETVEKIEDLNPDLVVGIDSPDFCLRVAQKLKARGVYRGKILHYVAPTIWAWRAGRGRHMAKFVDGVLCLFPFEPPLFHALGMSAAFVGHPAMESGLVHADPWAFRRRHGIASQCPVIGLFSGSRKGELTRTGSVIIQAMRRVLTQETSGKTLFAERSVVLMPTLPDLEQDIVRLSAPLLDHADVRIITARSEKWGAFRACDAALATSGTVGLELAIADVPHAIAYKMNPLTWQCVHRMVRVRFAHLVNIMENRGLVPEYIQNACTPESLAEALTNLLSDPAQGRAQRDVFQKIRRSLAPPPDQTAARIVAEFLHAVPSALSSANKAG